MIPTKNKAAGVLSDSDGKTPEVTRCPSMFLPPIAVSCEGHRSDAAPHRALHRPLRPGAVRQDRAGDSWSPMRHPLLTFPTLAAAATGALIVFASPAFAWHPTVAGSAVCAAPGQAKVTWKVGNSEQQMMHAKSRLGAFDVAHGATKTLDETVPAAGSVTLEVFGSWDGHEQNVRAVASVTLPSCPAPTATTVAPTTTIQPPAVQPNIGSAVVIERSLPAAESKPAAPVVTTPRFTG